jgi:hypothetical protein
MRLSDVAPPRSLDTAVTSVLAANTPVELEEGMFVVLGQRIGAGRQGVVYSVATCDRACVKISRNDIAAKQCRRERLGVSRFDSLGVAYPAILAADSLGKWIVKDRWYHVETGETLLTANRRRLMPQAIIALHEFVQAFENAGLCADWMPSNVVFSPGRCATFETSVWPVESCGWSFTTCFLPVWLPHGIAEGSLTGFPPYRWPAQQVAKVRRLWETDPGYETWRTLFGDFPTLCPDWWIADSGNDEHRIQPSVADEGVLAHRINR